jgi:hypothetical protein
MIRLSRQRADLEISVDGKSLVIQGQYQRPRLLTLDPMRSEFSRRRRTLFYLQYQLYMLCGWLSMSMHAEPVLHKARGMSDSDTCVIDI